MLKDEVVQSSVEGVYVEEERRTLALSYLISNLFEAKNLDECLDVAIKGLSMLDFFQSQISLLEDGYFVAKRNHMDKKYQILLEKIWGRKFLGHKIDIITSFASHLLNSRIVTTADIEDTVMVKMEDFIREYVSLETGESKRPNIVTRVFSILPKKIDLLMLPLNYRGKIIGAVGVSDTSLEHEDIFFLRNLCELLAQAFEKVQTKEDQRKSERKYRSLVEGAAAGIITVDPKGIFTFVNEAICEMMGYSEKELLGKFFADFVHPDDKKRVLQIFQSFLKAPSGKLSFEFRVIHRKGHVVHLYATPTIFTFNNEVVGSHAIITDITERKSAEEALREAKEKWISLTGNTNDIVMIVDNQGIIQYINTTIPPYTPEETVGKRVYEYVPREQHDVMRKSLRKVFKTGEPDSYEVSSNIPKSGTLWFSTKAVPIKSDEKVVSVILISADITERKESEERIRASEERYRSLVELAPDCIMTFDLKGVITSCNTAATEMSGYSKDELVGKHFTKIGPIRVRDIPKYLKMLASTLRGKVPKPFELIYHHKDGTQAFGEVRFSLIKERDKTVGIQAIMRDITERKKMEKVLEHQRNVVVTLSGAKDLNEAINRLFDNLLEIEEFDCAGFYLADEDTGDLDMIVHRGLPPRFVEKVGHLDADSPYAKVVMEGKPIYQKTSDFPPAIREDLQSDGILAVAAIPIHYKGEAIGDLNMASHTHDEISASTCRVLESVSAQIGENIVRTRMEEALRDSEKNWGDSFNSLEDVMILVNKDCTIEKINDSGLKLLGKTREEVTGKKCYQAIHGLDAPCELCPHERMLKTGKLELVDRYIELFDKYFSIKSSPISNERGEILGFVDLMRDVTKKKKAEEALRESEEKYRELLNGMNDTAWVIDFDCNFIDVNDAAVKVLGYSREELLSMGIFGIDFSLDPEEIKGLVKGMPSDEIQVFETAHTTKTGKKIPVEISSSLVTYQGKRAILSIARDITDRKRMEGEIVRYSEHLEELVEERTRELKEAQERLVKSERLAAIGEASTMVGHDLRNPLQSIENATYYLNNELPRLPVSQKITEMLQIINDSVNNADKIVRDLHDFASTKEPILRKTNVNAIVKETLSQVEAPENIKLITELNRLPEIKTDKDMLKRAFLNLTMNGIQAMENGGKLKVSTKKTKDFVEVSFKDTGIGISKENMKKLFTPFFTTKARGMGIGLSICKRFVESHSGSIEAESREGKGSTFTIKLPIRQNNGGENQ